MGGGREGDCFEKEIRLFFLPVRKKNCFFNFLQLCNFPFPSFPQEDGDISGVKLFFGGERGRGPGAAATAPFSYGACSAIYTWKEQLFMLFSGETNRNSKRVGLKITPSTSCERSATSPCSFRACFCSFFFLVKNKYRTFVLCFNCFVSAT